jgi:hypothetical protein
MTSSRAKWMQAERSKGGIRDRAVEIAVISPGVLKEKPVERAA